MLWDTPKDIRLILNAELLRGSWQKSSLCSFPVRVMSPVSLGLLASIVEERPLGIYSGHQWDSAGIQKSTVGSRGGAAILAGIVG